MIAILCGSLFLNFFPCTEHCYVSMDSVMWFWIQRKTIKSGNNEQLPSFIAMVRLINDKIKTSMIRIDKISFSFSSLFSFFFVCLNEGTGIIIFFISLVTFDDILQWHYEIIVRIKDQSFFLTFSFLFSFFILILLGFPFLQPTRLFFCSYLQISILILRKCINWISFFHIFIHRFAFKCRLVISFSYFIHIFYSLCFNESHLGDTF